METVEQLYVYVWGNNSKRETMRGRECIVLARGKKNSIMIEFLDCGQREIVSRFAVRKIKGQREQKKQLTLDYN